MVTSRRVVPNKFCVQLVLFGCSVLLPGQLAQADSTLTACQRQYADQKKQTYAEIKRLEKTLPRVLVGPMVESGKCTLRALKLGITFGTKRDYSNAVAISDAMDCLNIRLYEIDQECQCRAAGLTYAGDLEDDVLNEYRRVRSLEKKLLSIGIPNPAIKSYVSNLSVSKDCISQATLLKLQQTYKSLLELDTAN